MAAASASHHICAPTQHTTVVKILTNSPNVIPGDNYSLIGNLAEWLKTFVH